MRVAVVADPTTTRTTTGTTTTCSGIIGMLLVVVVVIVLPPCAYSWRATMSSNHRAADAFSVALEEFRGRSGGGVGSRSSSPNLLSVARRPRRRRPLFRAMLSASAESTGEGERSITHGDEAGADPSARRDRIFAPLSAAITAATAANYPSPAGALGSSFESAVSTYFPGSITNSELASRVILTLTKHRGFHPDEDGGNILLGASLCPDELNDTPTSLFSLLRYGLTGNHVGGVFNLGGLGGVPFVGPSGFDAFFSHCPKSGKVLIMYGPHVGISSDGVVGKVERVGMDGEKSGACGAALGAYRAIMAEKARADSAATGSSTAGGGSLPLPYTDPDAGDVQEDYIVRELRRRLESGSGLDSTTTKDDENSLITKVTNRMYDVVSDLLRREVDAKMRRDEDFFDKISEVTLLGGIVVNRGNVGGYRVVEDRFKPVTFQSFSRPRASVISTDLLRHLYDSSSSSYDQKIFVDVPSALAIGGAAAAATIGGVVALGRRRESEVDGDGRTEPTTTGGGAGPHAEETSTPTPPPAVDLPDAETTPPAAVEESPRPPPPPPPPPATVLPGPPVVVRRLANRNRGGIGRG